MAVSCHLWTCTEQSSVLLPRSRSRGRQIDRDRKRSASASPDLGRCKLLSLLAITIYCCRLLKLFLTALFAQIHQRLYLIHPVFNKPDHGCSTKMMTVDNFSFYSACLLRQWFDAVSSVSGGKLNPACVCSPAATFRLCFGKLCLSVCFSCELLLFCTFISRNFLH